ncbi:MAG: 50S ribosomal protein L13 [Dehalococcoidales bacterium]|jgi:large subunit ribosomal protein L13|nr:50S ribosomal protein L13 [Dehalococcoidales bacterium]MDP6043750.1 50S ribosomal protein L13 [Dehalococcoidales bacterium]MDP6448510.1 50S ribosomal protein L13 [Dehalococcoidales bacterium]MDP6576704.1 50S ribosomal protein L13 [Dehalococcoidales bacterium]MDP7285952.1 50S ribosomal protein L13 [Dehalococcoidales bacterium]
MQLKTYHAKPADIERQWHVIDGKDQTLGRLATRAASLLMGKHKPIFSPHQDTGDFVIVINADKVSVTGNKVRQKTYYRHSGYPGGLKSVTLGKMMQTNPTRAVEHAVKGMVPHTRLGNSMKKRLRVYTGDTHPHLAQVKTAEIEKG